MATYFYQSTPNTTKQAWLAHSKICKECGGQKSKEEFRIFAGVEYCKECWTEKVLENQ